MDSDKSKPPAYTPNSSVAQSSPKPPSRAAVLRATKARLSSSILPASDQAKAKAEAEARLAFLRIIDSVILERNPKNVAVLSLKTLKKITANALEKDDPKFRTLKAKFACQETHSGSTGLVSQILFDCAGACDYLLACKFAPKVIDFTETLVISSSPSPNQREALRNGRDILRSKLALAEVAKDTEDRMKAAEEKAESERKWRALQAAS